MTDQDCLAGDRPRHERVDRNVDLVPRHLELDGCGELARLEQADEPGQSVRGVQTRQLVEEVERVDARTRCSVESCGSERDDFVRSAGGEVDDQPLLCDVFDRGAERRSAHGIDDEVVLAVHFVVASGFGDSRPAERRELYGEASDASSRSGDEHSSAEEEAAELERAQGRQAGGGECRGR